MDGEDQVKYSYNRQGQTASMTDQNGTVHSYDYDLLGRQTQDRVTTVGSDVNNAILRIATTYEVRGMVLAVTSYNNATVGSGSVKNEVKHTYNDFAQLITEEEEHVGEVDGSTLKVQYAYEPGSANTIRPTTVTYPDGRVQTFSYGSGTDGDKLSRVETLHLGESIDMELVATNVSTYKYLGLGTIVNEEYVQSGVETELDYIGTANAYSGFDRFGRVVNQNWRDTMSPFSSVDQFLYGYDRASNRTYRENAVATSADLDELYGYDNLQRLTAGNRGQLVAAKDRIANHKLAQTWQLDPTGNWKVFSNFDQATPDNDLVQQRTANAANEITDVTETVGSQWITPVHDRSGNMTTIPQPAAPTSGFTCIYDAWNRLINVDDGGSQCADYSYDGLNRRIFKYDCDTGADYQHFYYNAAWQLLETRHSNDSPVPATAHYQYVWSLRYLDAPVLRDEIVSGPANDVRLYYTGDANFNITSLFNTSGSAVERYVYDPYGQVTIYNGTWSATQSPTVYNNSTLYTGQWRDAETGLMYYRRRYYHPGLGLFITTDPIAYGDGPHLYSYAKDNPLKLLDPTGRATMSKAEKAALKGCKCKAIETKLSLQDAIDLIQKQTFAEGFVACVKGKQKVVVVNRDATKPGADPCGLNACVAEHEQHHIDQAAIICPNPCKGVKDKPCSLLRWMCKGSMHECYAHGVGIACLVKKALAFKKAANAGCYSTTMKQVVDIELFMEFQYRCGKAIANGLAPLMPNNGDYKGLRGELDEIIKKIK